MSNVYVLMNCGRICQNETLLGIYSSIETLRKAVSEEIENDKMNVLAWKEYPVDGEEPETWDWAYVPTTTDKKYIKANGACYPDKFYLDTNLVGVNFTSDLNRRKIKYSIVGGNPFRCPNGATTFTGISVVGLASSIKDAEEIIRQKYDECGGLLLAIDLDTGKVSK